MDDSLFITQGLLLSLFSCALSARSTCVLLSPGPVGYPF